MQKEKKDLAEVIRSAGFRATRPRLSLLSFLEKADFPLSIQEIVDGLTRKVDQVTVYRMIESFKTAGLVREVNLQGDRPKYELADAENDHHHIVCTKCHRVEDFVGCGVERIEKKALQGSRQFAAITGHSFDLYGLCNTCAK
jgi:Fe2+ or Zn2+ uptake regulation protein